jgi:hypothetical protein
VRSESDGYVFYPKASSTLWGSRFYEMKLRVRVRMQSSLPVLCLHWHTLVTRPRLAVVLTVCCASRCPQILGLQERNDTTNVVEQDSYKFQNCETVRHSRAHALWIEQQELCRSTIHPGVLDSIRDLILVMVAVTRCAVVRSSMCMLACLPALLRLHLFVPACFEVHLVSVPTLSADVNYTARIRLAKLPFLSEIPMSSSATGAMSAERVVIPQGSVQVSVRVSWPTYRRPRPPVNHRFRLTYQLEVQLPTTLWQMFNMRTCPMILHASLTGLAACDAVHVLSTVAMP